MEANEIVQALLNRCKELGENIIHLDVNSKAGIYSAIVDTTSEDSYELEWNESEQVWE